MRKITIVLLFVIGFTALSCSKSSNHDDVTENTTKTPDETAINTEKVIGKWELFKHTELDANQNPLREKMKDNGSCPRSTFEFSKNQTYESFYYYESKKGDCKTDKGSEEIIKWRVKGNKILIRDGEGKEVEAYEIVTLNDTVLELKESLLGQEDHFEPGTAFLIRHFTRKN